MTKPIIDMPSKEELSDFVLKPYSEEEISLVPDLDGKVEKLMEFFGTSGVNYDKVLNSDKTAYPNYDYMAIPGQRDTQKWLQTVRDIYYKETQGTPRVQAIRLATSGWNVVETFDFLNWLRFYEEGAHLKYKTAQLWYESDAPGYFLPIKQEPKSNPGQDISLAKDTIEEDAEKKRTIEKQRQKLIGRLNSAEKLLCSPEGQMFAGKELETLVEAIYSIKKKIQLVNKKSTSTKLYEDMIIREANVLCKRGFADAAEVLHAIAQTIPPSPTPPDSPDRGSGSAGGLPSMGPGMPQNPPESAPNDMSVIPQAKSPAISQFLEGLETSKLTTDDELEVEDPVDVLEVMDAEDELVVEAQEALPPEPMPIGFPPPVAEENPLEVSEDEMTIEPEKAKDFDHIINSAFSDLTIDDVVAKLEDLAKIFKTREIPRQLAIVDMMLDSLGLASFFPALSEASNKAIESNNYISSRVEEIISMLRGTMETRELDLKKDNRNVSPEMEVFKQNLQEQEEREKTQKQSRKGLIAEKPLVETPQVEIGEDLGKAAPIMTPTPAVAPVAPTLPPPGM
jgi:hypothetical protein